MKNVLIIAGVLVVASLTSCKSDYDCTQTTEIFGQKISTTTTLSDKSKSEIEDYEKAGTVNGQTTTCDKK